MKRGQWYFTGVVLVGMFFLLSCSGEKGNTASKGSISYQTFYDQLSPYGTWIDYPSYGHVWHPTVTGEFRPYLTNGYWDYSTEGWFWMSNYQWGWAPFHYGRWIYDDFYGWLWIPGYEWSPAWVTWGMYDDFYAWAPLMPDVYVGARFGTWRPASMYWNFCRRSHLYDRDIYNAVEKRGFVSTHTGGVQIFNNFGNTRRHNEFYAKGPELNEVQKFVNRPVNTVQLRDVTHLKEMKREGNEMRMYRPTITRPQPREFRRIDNGQSNPVHTEGDHVNNGREQQRQNLDRLPVQHPPATRSSGRSGRRH